MLLIRLYLHETVNNKEYYTKVEALARELMDSKYGYQLMSDYPAMFELGGQGSANKEIIWAIPSSSEGPNMNQAYGSPSYRFQSKWYGSRLGHLYQYMVVL